MYPIRSSAQFKVQGCRLWKAIYLFSAIEPKECRMSKLGEEWKPSEKVLDLAV